MRALHAVPSALLRSAVLCIGAAEAQHSLDEALAVGDVRGAVPDECRELDGDEEDGQDDLWENEKDSGNCD